MQIAIAPLFGEGFASPFNDALDLAVAAILIKLLGFHWAFLPTLAAEAMPALDLAPTWTAAVLLVTGSQRWIWWVVAGLTVLAAVALWWFVRWHGS
ncbi:MAG TPA: LPXTG cell wall anchor domain-containing protein [Myxococcales bacterium]|nr:LPXTG cell wall anchor domain-containing protein [Myxococcales bacterium]